MRRDRQHLASGQVEREIVAFETLEWCDWADVVDPTQEVETLCASLWNNLQEDPADYEDRFRCGCACISTEEGCFPESNSLVPVND